MQYIGALQEQIERLNRTVLLLSTRQQGPEEIKKVIRSWYNSELKPSIVNIIREEFGESIEEIVQAWIQNEGESIIRSAVSEAMREYYTKTESDEMYVLKSNVKTERDMTEGNVYDVTYINQLADEYVAKNDLLDGYKADAAEGEVYSANGINSMIVDGTTASDPVEIPTVAKVEEMLGAPLNVFTTGDDARTGAYSADYINNLIAMPGQASVTANTKVTSIDYINSRIQGADNETVNDETKVPSVNYVDDGFIKTSGVSNIDDVQLNQKTGGTYSITMGSGSTITVETVNSP